MAAFLIIGCVWMIVVGGAALKVRAERMESIDSFQRQLRAFAGGLPALDDAPDLGPSSDTSPLPAALRTAELLRRILAALLVTVALSFLYALSARSRMAWGLTLLLLDILLAYVALLVYRRDKAAGTVSLFGGRRRHRERDGLTSADGPPLRNEGVPAAIA